MALQLGEVEHTSLLDDSVYERIVSATKGRQVPAETLLAPSEAPAPVLVPALAPAAPSPALAAPGQDVIGPGTLVQVTSGVVPALLGKEGVVGSWNEELSMWVVSVEGQSVCVPKDGVSLPGEVTLPPQDLAGGQWAEVGPAPATVPQAFAPVAPAPASQAQVPAAASAAAAPASLVRAQVAAKGGSVCAGCQQSITSDFLRAAGQSFHSACFKCCRCSQAIPIPGHYFRIDAANVCCGGCQAKGLAVTCPNGHILCLDSSQQAWKCDSPACALGLGQFDKHTAAQRLGCRACDFDLCEPCMQALTPDTKRNAPRVCAHDLAMFSTPRDGFLCDVCGETMTQAATMHGCRACDFDQCDACHQKKPLMRRPANEAQARMVKKGCC